MYSPLLLPVCRREQVCLLQLEQKTGSVWQICHSLSVFLTSLLLTVTITSQCFTDFLYFVIFFLLSPLSFTTFFPASQQLTLYLCHLTTLPRLPSLQSPLFLLLPSCYWQLSHSISDATVSNHLSFPPFTQSYTFSPPHPPLPYPWYWQLSWSTDLASFFFFLWQLSLFWSCSLWLDPRTVIQCDDSYSEHAETVFVFYFLCAPLYYFSFSLTSSHSSSQGFSAINLHSHLV